MWSIYFNTKILSFKNANKYGDKIYVWTRVGLSIAYDCTVIISSVITNKFIQISIHIGISRGVFSNQNITKVSMRIRGMSIEQWAMSRYLFYVTQWQNCLVKRNKSVKYFQSIYINWTIRWRSEYIYLKALRNPITFY